MVRDGVTQQRSFQWSGTNLASATNPENGTVSHTYDGAHHVLSRTDAKGQVTGYSYDAYGRLTALERTIPRESPTSDMPGGPFR